MQNTNGSIELPARTHAEAATLFRRPFATGCDRLSRDDEGAAQR